MTGQSSVKTRDVEKLRTYIEGRLKELGTKLVMPTIGSDDAESAIGFSVGYDDLRVAVASLPTKEFDLTVRTADDFSDTPYIWITPRAPEVSAFTKDNPPNPCYVIRSPDGQSSLRRDQGLYVFSQSGYAIGFAKSLGIGDFNVESYAWETLKKTLGGKGESVIVDYKDGTPVMNIIPLT